jgi:hypothetical protein
MTKNDLKGLKNIYIKLDTYVCFKTSYENLINDVINKLPVTIDKNEGTSNQRVVKLCASSLGYEEIKRRIQNNDCDLLTSFEEFNENNMDSKSRLEVKMKCGHIEGISLNLFQKRINYVCKKCINNDRKKDDTFEKERVTSTHLLDFKTFVRVQDILKKSFLIEKTHEGCKADFAIQPLSSNAKSWVGIQLKTRMCKGSAYSFSKIGTYEDMIVVCVALNSDEQINKIWVFNGNDLLGKTSISIGFSNSKYSDNEVTKDNLCERMLHYYTLIKKKSIEDLKTPCYANGMVEHKNRMIRHNVLSPHVQIEYPNVEGSKHDAIINNKRVQDKVAVERKNGMYVRFEGYIKGDNDFYFAFLPENMDANGVYLLPEQYMLDENGNIKNYINLRNEPQHFYIFSDVRRIINLFC